jgi:signal recognition particle GTPase
VQDVNTLVKQFRDMQKLMKQLGIMGNSRKKKQKGKQGKMPNMPARGMGEMLPSNFMDMFKN